MPVWMALLRGINVGGKHILPMKQLTEHLESLRLTNVKTYIQSGNVVFRSKRRSAAALETEIGDAIAAEHGFRPSVLVWSAQELQTAVQRNPFPEAEKQVKSLHVFFLAAQPLAADLGSLTKVKSSSERFKIVDRAFYLHAPDGIGRSKLAANAERYLGVPATARNWRTVTKLAEMVAE